MAAGNAHKIAGHIEGLIITEGVLAVLFGVIALFYPGETLVTIVVLFGIFVLLWGIINLISSIANSATGGLWWLQLIFGFLTIGLGVYLLRNLALSLSTVILLAGFTFIVRGIVELLSALFGRERNANGDSRVLYIISGLVAIAAGIIVLAQPVASGIAFVWIVGLYAILTGSLAIATTFRVRSLAR